MAFGTQHRKRAYYGMARRSGMKLQIPTTKRHSIEHIEEEHGVVESIESIGTWKEIVQRRDQKYMAMESVSERAKWFVNRGVF